MEVPILYVLFEKCFGLYMYLGTSFLAHLPDLAYNHGKVY